MSNYKIIFTGPVGAGKTTAITALSDVPPVTTDEAASDMTKTMKQSTTVALDYGMMKLDGDERIHLYGTPGQERFDFMWDILSEGGLGLILLLDNTRADPFKDLHFFLESFKEFIAESKLVVGVTRMDLSDNPPLSEYHKQLDSANINPPVFAVDARQRRDVYVMTQALLYSLDPGLGG
ncbi:MAG: GTP-binding protein [Gammaproteobacteria bacterium]|nr:GTP-binding protein [Gammaproteobacteria bacterium]